MDTGSKPAEQARLGDARRLREEFYAAFDRSLLETLLRRGDKELDQRGQLLGEGTHFKAWRLPSRGATVPSMDIVLKRATPGLAGPGGLGLRQWAAAMDRLKRLVGSTAAAGLLPPFEVLRLTDGAGAGDTLALAMPYGGAPLGAAAAHWQPLDERVAELKRLLIANGLVFADVPQGCSHRGVPFLYDLSDIYER